MVKVKSMMNYVSSRLNQSILLGIGVLLVSIAGCNSSSDLPANSSSDLPDGKVVDIVQFGDGLAAEDLVLVKFGANWCGPCREVEKELDSLDAEKLGVKIVKIDVDERPELSQQFNVRGIPHLMLVRNGKTLQERTGYHSADELSRWIRRYPKP